MKKSIKLKLAFVLIIFMFPLSLLFKDEGLSAPLSNASLHDSLNSEIIEISLWTFPIGDFGNKEIVESFIANFNKIYPNIHVNVKILDYATGDATIEAAIESRNAPDIVMEGPERIVANYGARGLMIDISDMWDEEITSNILAISPKLVEACKAPDGAFYEYPMVMTTHVMAINYDIFKKANALQYIDQKNRTWTTKDFVRAMEKVRDSGLVQTPGIIYTGSQGGDQGTRALVTNLYSAAFTNPDHNAYVINEELGVKGLQLLVDMVNNGSLSHDSTIAAAQELQKFAKGDTAITLAWNATNEEHYASQIDFTPFAMNFPSDNGEVQLQGGIWGFGIFNKGKMAKVIAAKKFIKFLVNDPVQSKKSIMATNFFSVNKSYAGVYQGTEKEKRMLVYSLFMPNFGDYYQITPVWPQQRVAWYTMLQDIFSGTDVQKATDNYVNHLTSLIHP